MYEYMVIWSMLCNITYENNGRRNHAPPKFGTPPVCGILPAGAAILPTGL